MSEDTTPANTNEADRNPNSLASKEHICHSADTLPYCHGLNAMELISTSSMTSELSTTALCSVYLPLYSYTSRSPHGVGVISPDKSNHLGVNLCPLASRFLFSALCCSSSLKYQHHRENVNNINNNRL